MSRKLSYCQYVVKDKATKCFRAADPGTARKEMSVTKGYGAEALAKILDLERPPSEDDCPADAAATPPSARHRHPLIPHPPLLRSAVRHERVYAALGGSA